MANRKRIVKNMSLQEQAAEILRRATEKGVSSNFFFVTTFKRYQVQLQLLEELEAEINKSGATVKKTYVKGRENVALNPAIDGYNKTSSAANSTVSTLISIIDKIGNEKPEKKSGLMQLMESME